MYLFMPEQSPVSPTPSDQQKAPAEAPKQAAPSGRRAQGKNTSQSDKSSKSGSQKRGTRQHQHNHPVKPPKGLGGDLTRKFAVGFLVLLLVASIFSSYNQQPKVDHIALSHVAQQVRDGQVTKVSVKENELEIEKTDGSKQASRKEAETGLSESFTNYGVTPEQLSKVEIVQDVPSGISFWLMNVILPYIFPFVLIGLVLFFMVRSVQRGNNRALSFGQSKAKEYEPSDKNKVRFVDFAGADEAKEELWEVVEFLKSPKKFEDLGAEIPKGVLLVGPPGTGKTLLARAVAGEAGAPFFSISGSEFVEMFVGVGASRVRDLFLKAKKVAPAIIFIDEIDAVGRQRGSGLGGSHDEREQTLNQILTEMDGFEQGTNVIVVAATNRPDVLDPALLRPGRFDRQVTIGLPDKKDRAKILAIHARNKPLGADVDLLRLAQRTPGFAGAELKNLMNEGAILAARAGRKEILMQDCFDAIEKVMLGPQRKSFLMNEEEKKITAFHEAGHAVVGHVLPGSDPIQKISIVSRGRAAGYTLNIPEDDRHFRSKRQFEDDLAMMLGGYVAEQEIFGELTTGASSDLSKATKLARKMVTEYGMSGLGPVTFGEKDEFIFLGRDMGEQRDYSESTAARIDAEVQKFIDEAKAKAEGVVRGHRAKLEEVALRLIEIEIIEREEFEKLMAAVPQEKPMGA